MQRIAAPMVGGMLTAPLLSLFVLPAWYAYRWRNNVEHETPARRRIGGVGTNAMDGNLGL